MACGVPPRLASHLSAGDAIQPFPDVRLCLPRLPDPSPATSRLSCTCACRPSGRCRRRSMLRWWREIPRTRSAPATSHEPSSTPSGIHRTNPSVHRWQERGTRDGGRRGRWRTGSNVGSGGKGGKSRPGSIPVPQQSIPLGWNRDLREMVTVEQRRWRCEDGNGGNDGMERHDEGVETARTTRNEVDAAPGRRGRSPPAEGGCRRPARAVIDGWNEPRLNIQRMVDVALADLRCCHSSER